MNILQPVLHVILMFSLLLFQVPPPHFLHTKEENSSSGAHPPCVSHLCVLSHLVPVTPSYLVYLMLIFQVERTVSVVTETETPAETESNPPPDSAAETSPTLPTAPSPMEEEEEEEEEAEEECVSALQLVGG